MNKYNLSEKEANEILNNLEQKTKNQQYSSQNKKILTNNNLNYKNNEIQQLSKNNTQTTHYELEKKKIAANKTIIQNKSSTSKINKIYEHEESKQKTSIEKTPTQIKHTEKQSQKQDVDKILTNIMPNYNQDLSIEVKNVNLTFEVDNEKIDTLKESFIRLFKRNKSKKFKVEALKNINFNIYKGEKIGIIGYNGAGKSTLLNVITGIYNPDKGFVKTYGKISPLLSLGSGFDYNYSGRRNIFFNGAVLGYDKEYIESKVNEIIEFSELGDYIDIPIKNYSSGMLAKLGFSIATIVNPDILIIDEILSVGDVTFQKKSSDKIKSLMDGGTTVLLVSHSIPQIRELCDKAIWINNGYVKEIGEVNKVCDHYLKDAEKATNEQLANIKFK